jgi:predicted RNA binding protein YcfA (HicA-like mRNA interferase family)
MTKADKLRDKMRNNPRDWRIADLETLAARYGLGIRKSGGSHAVFYHIASGQAVTVPARRPIKPIYIKAFLRLLDDIGE